MREKIVSIVTCALSDLGKELKIESLEKPELQTPIYGDSASLGSMELVALIADVEQRIKDQFQKDVILADERAMSRKRSPFQNVETLVEYTESLLEEGKN